MSILYDFTMNYMVFDEDFIEIFWDLSTKNMD